MTISKYLLLLVYLSAGPMMAEGTASEEFVVVVRQENTIELTILEIARVFLGKTNSYPGGRSCHPVMQDPEESIGKAFLQGVLNKRPTQYRRYWSYMIFTGEAMPPPIYTDDGKVKAAMMEKDGSIGIIRQSSVDKRFRVVAKFTGD